MDTQTYLDFASRCTIISRAEIHHLVDDVKKKICGECSFLKENSKKNTNLALSLVAPKNMEKLF